jgi:hypothetical protein
MMDEGYFVSRGDILKWINDLLQVRIYSLSWTWQKYNNWDLGQFIVRLLTSFILEK